MSGGVWGRTEGYCLMVGGDVDDVTVIEPLVTALAPADGWAHVGPVGAGHYAKMVHNGVEYALMQAYGEGYEILRASPIGLDVPAVLQAVTGWVDDSGEGRWTLREATDMAVPAPTIAAGRRQKRPIAGGFTVCDRPRRH